LYCRPNGARACCQKSAASILNIRSKMVGRPQRSISQLTGLGRSGRSIRPLLSILDADLCCQLRVVGAWLKHLNFISCHCLLNKTTRNYEIHCLVQESSLFGCLGSCLNIKMSIAFEVQLYSTIPLDGQDFKTHSIRV